MHSAPAQTRPRVAAVRRLLVALVAAAALAGGAAAVMSIDHTDGSQHARWHQGWVPRGRNLVLRLVRRLGIDLVEKVIESGGGARLNW